MSPKLLLPIAAMLLSAAAAIAQPTPTAVKATKPEAAAIDFEAIDLPRQGGVLHAALYKPSGTGPFPAVIALHGCDGLGEPVKRRYAEWAQRLVQSGHAVLWPDSYGSRDIGPQCHVKNRRVLARRERLADVLSARHWLAEQPFVIRERIGLIGWDNGASALLWAVRPQLVLGKGDPDFRAAVAFYPDCRLSSRSGWSARAPTLVLIGSNDDISSPPSCRTMVDGAHGRSALAQLVVYPGAYHGFDIPEVPVHLTSADPSEPGRGHIGSDPAARRDAEKRVAHWLGR